MNKRKKLCEDKGWSALFFPFCISFVASLPGLAAVAFSYGWHNNQTTTYNGRHWKKISVKQLLLMELGFTISAVLHYGLLADLKLSAYILIGLGLGLFAFSVGLILGRIEKMKKIYGDRYRHFIFFRLLGI